MVNNSLVGLLCFLLKKGSVIFNCNRINIIQFPVGIASWCLLCILLFGTHLLLFKKEKHLQMIRAREGLHDELSRVT